MCSYGISFFQLHFLFHLCFKEKFKNHLPSKILFQFDALTKNATHKKKIQKEIVDREEKRKKFSDSVVTAR